MIKFEGNGNSNLSCFTPNLIYNEQSGFGNNITLQPTSDILKGNSEDSNRYYTEYLKYLDNGKKVISEFSNSYNTFKNNIIENTPDKKVGLNNFSVFQSTPRKEMKENLLGKKRIKQSKKAKNNQNYNDQSFANQNVSVMNSIPSKGSKINSFGLREISKYVMNIVQRDKSTSYKEISDNIVNTLGLGKEKDEKNIRRRIYDALNVLKALNIFKNDDKNSKAIIWNGKSPKLQESEEMKKVNSDILTQQKINYKKKQIYLAQKTQNFTIKKTIIENKKRDAKINDKDKIYFPFILIKFLESPETKATILTDEMKTRVHVALNVPMQTLGDYDIIKLLHRMKN